MRKSDRLSLVIALLLLLLLVTALDSLLSDAQQSDRHRHMINQVKHLGLTDLSLFTEARYIRHLSQADRHSPFQDHPMALEHFPSGSLIVPPAAQR